MIDGNHNLEAFPKRLIVSLITLQTNVIVLVVLAMVDRLSNRHAFLGGSIKEVISVTVIALSLVTSNHTLQIHLSLTGSVL